jgi:MFS family permease
MRAWLELRRLPRRVWALSAAALINRMGTMALPFLTLYMTQALGWPAPRAALLVTLYGAVAFLIGPFAGRLCDSLGPARLMRASLVASGLTMLVFPLFESFAAVALMTVVWAASTEAFRPANMTAITDSVPPALRKQAYALHRTALNLGMSVGPAAGGWLATRSFSAIWLVDGVTTLLAAAVVFSLVGEARAEAEAPAGPTPAGLRDGALLVGLAGVVLVAVVFFQHEAALPLHLVRGLGLTPQFYGLLFTVNTLLIVLLEIPLNHATAHWPHRRNLVAGALLIAAGFGGYGLCRGAWDVVAATVVWTFGEMILFPAMSAYVAALAPVSRRGEYMGLYLMAFSAGFMLGPWAGVWLLERRGPAALWAAAAAVGLLACAVFSRAGEPAPARA